MDFFDRGGGLQAGTFEHLYIAITPGENLKEVFSGRIDLIQQHEGNEPHSRGLENATFEQQRQLIDMQDARGRYAIENDENVVYINWILGQQLVSVAQKSPSSSTGNRHQVFIITARLALSGDYIVPRMKVDVLSDSLGYQVEEKQKFTSSAEV